MNPLLLLAQGYSIFVVKGRLPNEHPDAGRLDTPGKWFSPEEVLLLSFVPCSSPAHTVTTALATCTSAHAVTE